MGRFAVASAIVGSLKDKVTMVTGASSGIGEATAIYFSEQGAKLALGGRNVANLTSVADRCKQLGAETIIAVGDVNDEEYAKALTQQTVDHFKCIDVLVNNAGAQLGGSIETTTLAQYDAMMNVNVRSVYHLTMLATPHLIKTKGSIVNVSSVGSLRAFPNLLAYCMSKAAIDQFTRCVALELADKQVRVNSVNPGVIITDIHKRSGMSESDYAKFLEKCKQTHALGRPGDAIEVAKSIAFLASDAASFSTGVNLSVDGGRHAMCPR